MLTDRQRVRRRSRGRHPGVRAATKSYYRSDLCDEGRSGVRINRRPALAEPIKDIQSENTDFEQVLVYDVSRWGRLQGCR